MGWVVTVACVQPLWHGKASMWVAMCLHFLLAYILQAKKCQSIALRWFEITVLKKKSKKNRTSFFYLGRKENAEEEAPMRICFPHNSGIPCLLAFASCLCTPQKKAARGCWKLSVPPPLPLTKCGTAQWCMCLIHHRAKHYIMTPDTEKHGNPHVLQYMSRDALQ